MVVGAWRRPQIIIRWTDDLGELAGEPWKRVVSDRVAWRSLKEACITCIGLTGAPINKWPPGRTFRIISLGWFSTMYTALNVFKVIKYTEKRWNFTGYEYYHKNHQEKTGCSDVSWTTWSFQCDLIWLWYVTTPTSPSTIRAECWMFSVTNCWGIWGDIFVT